MQKTTKFLKALDLLSIKTNFPQEYIEQYFEKNGISHVRIYQGMQVMSYYWTGEEWQRMYKLPNWYRHLRAGVN